MAGFSGDEYAAARCRPRGSPGPAAPSIDECDPGAAATSLAFACARRPVIRMTDERVRLAKIFQGGLWRKHLVRAKLLAIAAGQPSERRGFDELVVLRSHVIA